MNCTVEAEDKVICLQCHPKRSTQGKMNLCKFHGSPYNSRQSILLKTTNVNLVVRGSTKSDGFDL